MFQADHDTLSHGDIRERLADGETPDAIVASPIPGRWPCTRAVAGVALASGILCVAIAAAFDGIHDSGLLSLVVLAAITAVVYALLRLLVAGWRHPTEAEQAVRRWRIDVIRGRIAESARRPDIR